ncbi:shikimate dehydrogenase [Nanoarchaeota archaeon]
MICVSVFGICEKEIMSKIKESKADIIEFRADLSENYSLKKVISACKKKIIVTNRVKEEGGEFVGDEVAREKFFEDAVKYGADYIDVEYSSFRIPPVNGKTKIILSYHNLSNCNDLERMFDEMKDKADIIKIVGNANSLSDNLTTFKILKRAQEEKIKLISFCMGEYGEISRILCLKEGSFLTYAKEGDASAPGQIDLSIMRNVYQVNKLNDKTKVYGLVGNPVKKSKGYLVHNAAFKNLKLNSVYVNFLVEDVKEFMEDFNGFYSGLSVTMPHKQETMSYLDDIEEVAGKINAINTVVVKEGKKIGQNTDWIGALKAIEERGPIKGRDVLVLGCGGAGRAIAFGIKNKGGLLTVVDTDVDKRDALAKDVGCEKMLPVDIANQKFDIVINATPIGMHPKVDVTPFDKKIYRKGMIVLDAVYNPLKTKTLKEAEKAGCKIISGVEMFINQGVAQFEMWTNKKAPVRIMKKIVLESLK